MTPQSSRFRTFKTLALNQKIHFVHTQAVDLQLTVQASEEDADLFSCDDFFIEVIVKRGTNLVLAIDAFRSQARLKPYLSCIDISPLTNLLSLR